MEKSNKQVALTLRPEPEKKSLDREKLHRLYIAVLLED